MKNILILGHIGIGTSILHEIALQKNIDINFLATIDELKDDVKPEPKFDASDISRLVELIAPKYKEFKELKPKFTNKFNKNSHRRK